ncbi:Bug family tripartite tricarboxylate transporter substrate binding protein [Cupriavidus taiwanensis]|uniref:Bug family tripartite tricarboxylate transporter substrate binding protein n=1 Tax=Cupriavidus taiwanensis TaxID=164546 RepID=UPI0039C00327
MPYRVPFAHSLSLLAPGWLAVAAVVAIAPQPAHAGAYPERPVTIVVPFPPGGGTDTGARLIAQRLAELWGHAVIVENKPGAAGQIGSAYVARAKPDGYTLLMGNIGTHSINPTLYKTVPYNAVKDFAPVSLVAELPLVMVTASGNAANTVPLAIAAGKREPGKVTYGSSGSGSSMHLAGAVFARQAGVDMLHVAYKGGGPAVADVMAGHVNYAFATLYETMGLIKGGKLRPVAVTSDKRAPLMPDVPTVAEAGLPGYDSISWIGLLAPAGTPPAIVGKIAQDVRTALADPKVKQTLADQGAVPSGSTPEAFASVMARDTTRYARVIREQGIKAE